MYPRMAVMLPLFAIAPAVNVIGEAGDDPSFGEQIFAPPGPTGRQGLDAPDPETGGVEVAPPAPTATVTEAFVVPKALRAIKF
jgi:hypothetical protein